MSLTRHLVHPDVRATVRAVVSDARRRGRIAAVVALLLEAIDLMRTIVRAALGRRMPISSGWNPRPSRKGPTHVQTLLRDIKQAARGLSTGRVQTGIAVATLALGIGISSAIFSVLDSILLRPMPFADAHRLAEIWTENKTSQFSYPRVSRNLWLEWRKQSDVFDRVEAYEIESAIYTSPRGAEMVGASYVTPGLLPMLGVRPQMGRLLVEGDGRDGTDDRVVVSARFWRSALQQDPEVIGRSIVLNGRPHQIVGVMPTSFHYPNRGQELWLPIDLEQLPARRLKGAVTITPLARVRSDVTIDQAVAQVAQRGEDLTTAAGGRAGTGSVLRPGRLVDNTVRQSLIVLSAAVGFLLLIVCANVANLALARTLGRARDLAVRASLGATRGDLVRQTFIENLLIGVVGAGLGVGVAWVALSVGASALPQQVTFSAVNAVDLDVRVLLFAAAAGIVASVLFGLPPAFMASRPNVVAVLRQDLRTGSASSATRRLRAALVIGEVTVAIVLLVGAALMARSFYKLQSVDRGFDTDGLIALQLGLPANGYADPYERDRFTDDLLGRLRALPGVTAASAGSVPPDSSELHFGRTEFAHAPDAVAKDNLVFPVYKAWPGYFKAIGLPLLEGREFTDGDTSGDVIISETLARDFWPGQSAVGGQFRIAGRKTWKKVVGVVPDVRQLDLEDRSGSYEWFEPLRTPPGRTPAVVDDAMIEIIDYRTMVVRADNPAVVLSELTRTVHAADRRVVIWESNLVDDLYARAVERPRAILAVLLTFAGLALILAAAGLYGVLSHLVSQRLREIGIRLALGAHPTSVFQLVMRNGLWLTATGLVFGLASAVILTRLMRTLLYEVESFDPVALVVVSVLLLLTALVACWRPARRAMRVDPVQLLRES